MEIWKDIVGFEGLYQISSEGRLKSLERYCASKNGSVRIKKEKIICRNRKDNTYISVKLQSEGRKRFTTMHRLVAEAFIPNINNLPDVNHKNENKSDNRVENLEWCDRAYNNAYGTRTKRSSETMKGRVFTPEHCSRISEAKKNQHLSHTEDWKKEHSNRMKGENNPIFGVRRRRVYNDDGTYNYEVINIKDE